MKTLIKKNKLFLVTIAVTALNFSWLGSVEASTLKGKFNFEGDSTYCNQAEPENRPSDAKNIMMMASLMLTKEKNAQGMEVLVPEKSTVQFSITKDEYNSKCKGERLSRDWESRPMKVTHADFDEQWNLKSFKFLDFAEKNYNPEEYKKLKDNFDADPTNYVPPISKYAHFAYMTGFFDFMMTQKAITFYLLDYNFNKFGGSPPPMSVDLVTARNSLDSGDFNKNARRGRPSDTTTIMGLPNKVMLEHVPEPTSTLSLLALGTLGAASTLKRFQKNK